jgi:plastocyanin
MHSVALQLAPVLATEKSKVPFYVAAGLLIAWALILSLVIGGRKPDFPSNLSGQRAVIAITAVLVLFTAAMAVVTAGTPAKGATTTSTNAASSATFPGPEVTTASTAASTTATTSETTATQPTATTGTPAPASSPAAGSSLRLAANSGGALSYNTKSLSAKAGTVTITMANMSPVEHNVTIAQGTTVLGATPTFAGGTKTLTLKLKPGKYTFYCSVPGHRAAGMEGTLTVS